MRKTNNEYIYSPSDLIRYMESPFASWMERFDLEKPGTLERDQEDAEGKLVAEAGDEHENAYLFSLREKNFDVCEILRNKEAKELTLKAIKDQRQIIFQPYLEMNGFGGYADFLKLNEDGMYEVWDTKLARSVKPYFLVQLCCYSEMLSTITGQLPQKVGIILGNLNEEEFRTAEHFDYYLNLKKSFLEQMAQWSESNRPDPLPGAEHRDWSGAAENWMKEQDHLCLVASLRSNQVKKFNDAGINTVAELATTLKTRIKGMSDVTLGNLKEQARLQVETRKMREQKSEECPPLFEVRKHIESKAPRGLSLLPPASPLDAYFDLEGFPLMKDGLEYLWGATHIESGSPEFTDWWAHDHHEEEEAFIQFMDWAYSRWKKDPHMHIYHYAPYEITALKRISGRCGKREDELDDLLRNGVFIDLYKVVRQGLLVGEGSYSIKKIERLYRPARDGDVSTSMGSVIAYADWMKSGEPDDWESSELLRAIRDYNKDDCDSTWELAEWLRGLQKENAISHIPLVKDTGKDQSESDPEKERALAEKKRLVRELESKADSNPGKATGKISRMLQHLLEFHRREEKPGWWQLFEWNDTEHERLVDDDDCLGNLKADGSAPQKEAKSLIFSYAYDPDQQTKIEEGQYVKISGSLTPVRVHEINPSEKKVLLKISEKALGEKLENSMPTRLSLLPHELVPAAPIPQAIEQVASEWLKDESLPRPLRDFLLRSCPDISGVPRGQPLITGKDKEACALSVVRNMVNTTLCIQGPPGAGKTYLSSHLILDLLSQGKKVGISSNSHKAILNLLAACSKNTENPIKAVKVGGDKNDAILLKHKEIQHQGSPQKASAEYEDGLIGGTAWFFSRDDMKERLDYLFIDEAGQVSVANLVGMSRCAQNFVLIGDQMQLQQPLQGTHPGESGHSLLDYYLHEHSIVPPEKGIFLDTTWRLHPDICKFVSDCFYNGKLLPHPDNRNRSIDPPQGGKGLVGKPAGIVFLPVEHSGNSRYSDEEVSVAKRAFEELIGRPSTDREGKPDSPLAIEDFLFIAPYNAQVRRLRDALPDGARVGSVDKLQGQEAKVVILSLCASYGEASPRGIDFLLNRHRMNVAVSRGQTLAVVIGDPRIALSPANSVGEMACLNLLAKLSS
jgi:uncharacterized protein